MRLSWEWILLILVAIGFFLFSKGTRSYWNQKKYLGELQKKIKETHLKNEKLALEIHHLKTDPKAIEQIARRELGLIQPGEIEYRFVVLRSTLLETEEDKSSPRR